MSSLGMSVVEGPREIGVQVRRSDGRRSNRVEPDLVNIQRARLIRAACEICGERNGDDVSIANIVAQAGVSRRTFYEIFHDREDCLLAAFDESVTMARAHVIPAYADSTQWRSKIREGLEALLGFLDAEPAAGYVLIVTSQAAGPRVLARRRLLIDQLVVAVDAGRQVSRSSSALTKLTAEGVVGGVLSVLHDRMIAGRVDPLILLRGQLMSLIALPYLGPKAATAELTCPLGERRAPVKTASANPLGDLGMRLTYRTARVLAAVTANPGASNRAISDAADIGDQGQVSKLLGRLQRLGLLDNDKPSSMSRVRNSWRLTDRGREVADVITAQRAGL